MLKSYFILAFKVLQRRRFFTFISLFAVSFTLTILMTTTALLDHIFGPQPPETKSDRTLGIYSMEMTGPQYRTGGSPGYKLLNDIARRLSDVESVSIYSEQRSVAAYLNGDKLSLSLKRTDGNFWQILDFTLLEGGTFTTEDDQSGRTVAVINESMARKFFGNGSALDQAITVDGQTFRVVGVVKNVSSLRVTPYADIWVPIGTAYNNAYKSQLYGGFQCMILAHSSADFDRIKADFAEMLSKVELPDPKVYDHLSVVPESYFESTAREVFGSPGGGSNAGALIVTIGGLMILFMMLPTVNLMNINISRILERASEIGVRKAFGASSLTLVGQFVVENLILTLLGGIIAFVVTIFGLQLLSSFDLIPSAEFQMNYRVFFYSLALAVFFGLLSGVYPAWRMSRLQPVEALRGRIQ